MLSRETTCCFTGHRESKLPWHGNEQDERCIDLKKRIFDVVEAVYTSGIRHYISGMANGCDMFFGEAVMKLKEIYPDVTLEAAIPYTGQAERWRDTLQSRYNEIMSSADFHTLVCRAYTYDCMKRRNRYMVDNSSVIIAAYNGESGGTQQTLLYAMRQKIEIIELMI